MSRILFALVLLASASPIAAQSVRCTTQELGSLTHTSCSDGTRASTQRIGAQSHTTFSDGTRSSTQRVGGFTYYHDNRGNAGSTQQIGSFSFTTITGPAGSVRGSSQRIGHTTYGSYTVSAPEGASGRASLPSVPPLLPLPR